MALRLHLCDLAHGSVSAFRCLESGAFLASFDAILTTVFDALIAYSRRSATGYLAFLASPISHDSKLQISLGGVEI